MLMVVLWWEPRARYPLDWVLGKLTSGLSTPMGFNCVRLIQTWNCQSYKAIVFNENVSDAIEFFVDSRVHDLNV